MVFFICKYNCKIMGFQKRKFMEEKLKNIMAVEIIHLLDHKKTG